jgi:hypothetical protein
MPLGDLINQVLISQDKSYIYLTTSDDSGNIAIRRVGLRGQKTPSFIFQLQDVLPEATPGAGYSVGFINFSGTPVVQVVLADGGPGNAGQLVSQQLQVVQGD